MPGHVYWLDKNNVYQGCNNIQAEAAKLNSPKEIVGKTNYDMIWKVDAERLNATNMEVMSSGKAQSMEETAVMAQGPGIYLSEKVPLFNQDHSDVIGILGISFDITERKRTEEALKVAKEKAEVANQVKTEFIRNMEHDIRTPISGIFGVANYLKSHQSNPKHQELLSDIESASSELLDYLNNILEFSQITQDVLPIVWKDLYLKEIIESILRMEVPALKHKNLELETIYSPNLPDVLIGDTFRVYRIILNLVSNAIKFTDAGKIVIEAKIISQENNNVILQVSVSDTGIGIPENQQQMIYDKLTRCCPANKGTYKGSGVGLWVVKQFITELNGSVELESTVGKGSVFTITLPLQIPN
jgi:two-component system aerobic respiration control sensor histidine kinase ArcB